MTGNKSCNLLFALALFKFASWKTTLQFIERGVTESISHTEQPINTNILWHAQKVFKKKSNPKFTDTAIVVCDVLDT